MMYVSKSFMKRLRVFAGKQKFTTKQAEQFYRIYFKHWIWDETSGRKVLRLLTPKEIANRAWYWEDATARGYIATAVKTEKWNLKRVKRGVYQFTK